MRISIVIPVYNEERNLEPLYEKLCLRSDFSWEAILVDDGSTDGTLNILKKIAAKDPRIKIVSFNKNYGQTSALSAGFDLASEDIIVCLDGDLQNDPADIPLLLEKISQGYDVVSGWRKKRKDNFLVRRLPSMVANSLISIITGVVLKDYGCTFKAYKRECLKNVKLYGEMHRFIPAYAAWHGAKIAEIEVSHLPRKFEKTKYGLGRTFKVIWDLITVKFLISYSTKPMHFFGKTAFWSFFLSFSSLVLAIYYKLSGLKSFIETPLPLFSALFFMVGIQLLLMGLCAELMIRNYYEILGKPTYNIKEKVNF